MAAKIARRDEESLARCRALVGRSVDDDGMVMEAERDIPGTPIRAGDYVFLRSSYYEREPFRVAGAALLVRVPRASLAAVETALGDGLRILGRVDDEELRGERRRLRRRQLPSSRDETSPLYIVRPLVAPVSEPIVAASDAAAIFELLASVGCRMPQGVDHA